MLGRGIRLALGAALVAAELIVPGGAQAAHAAGIPAAGYAVTDFATGFQAAFCCPPLGPIGVAFDAAGQLFVTDYPAGQLFKFGPSGGSADASHLAVSGLGTGAAGLAFTKDGTLYLAEQWKHQVVRLNPISGATTPMGQPLDSPTGLAVDPVSGDLFTDAVGVVYRLSNPTDPQATWIPYVTAGVDGLTFAPDGTLYASGSGAVWKIVAGQAKKIADVSGADGIALVAPAAGQPITQLAVNSNFGVISLVDFSVAPATVTPIVTNGTRGDFVAVGPDKCLYATQTDSVEKITAADGSCPFLPTGVVTTPRPNPPQNVMNVGNVAGGVVVTWQPPVPNGATLDHYNVYESGSTTILATVPASAAQLFAVIPQLNLCTYYRFGVAAVGADGQQSAIALPIKPAFTQGSPKSPPTTVAILVAGINTDIGYGVFNPLDVFDYCTTLDGVNPNSASSTYPVPLAGMNHEWNVEDDPAHSPSFGAGSRMIDTIASTGAVVVPFSYTHAALSGPASAPTFTFAAYSAAKVARTAPEVAARTLNDEIRSIHSVWGDARIVLVGHSNGGLVSELWWEFYGSHDRQGVVQVFALDSPLNGVLSDICSTYACGLPHVFGVGKELADTYKALWLNQATLDPLFVALDAKTDLFTPIGTVNDPVYDPPDFSVNILRHNGLLSQLYFSEPSCANSGFDLSSSACSLVGKDFVSPCTIDDGPPPNFGVPFSLWLHSVAKNCPGVIAKVMTYVQ